MSYLLLASLGSAIAIVWLRGGGLGELGDVKFLFWWMIPTVATVQSVLIRVPYSDTRLPWWHPRPYAMLISYVVLWCAVWLNQRLPGMRIVLAGITLNLIVIAANGGYMPVRPEALARIGYGDAAYQMQPGSIVLGSKDVVLPTQQAPLWMLGDVLVIPEPFPRPTAMSIGDMLLAVGVFLFITQTAGRQTKRQRTLCETQTAPLTGGISEK
jgi:hypothetical protein